jgi:hypothetical protein
MKNEIPKNIIKIRNEIYKDIYDENNWVYVKIQSLLEYISKYYFQVNSLYETEEFISNIDRIEIIINRLSISYEKLTFFKQINRKANIIKHSINTKTEFEAKFDKILLSRFINHFNDFCVVLFREEAGIYQLEDFNNSKFNFSSKTSDKFIRTDSKGKYKSKIVQSRVKKIYSGVSKHDYGFKVFDIVKKSEQNIRYTELYAVIYNLLQRSGNISKSQFIVERESKEKIKRN